jgi:hypothetical protein
MVVNFKPINKITKKYKAPVPRVDDTLNLFLGALFFCILDFRRGYFQIELADCTKIKAGFSTPFGIFQFKRLPFGFADGPAYFCAIMRALLGHLQFLAIYFDDLIIFAQTMQQLLENLKEVFEILKANDLKLNPDKCEFFKRKIKVLGQ